MSTKKFINQKELIASFGDDYFDTMIMVWHNRDSWHQQQQQQINFWICQIYQTKQIYVTGNCGFKIRIKLIQNYWLRTREDFNKMFFNTFIYGYQYE